MNLLFDTNIFVQVSKGQPYEQIKEITNPDNQKVYASVATIGELKSIALQNNWGTKKFRAIDRVMHEVTIIEVTQNLLNIYAEIDAFSQHKNPLYKNYSFPTPRNMGKNDLWIAATAALLGLKLVTTDADFSHLNGIYIEIQLLKPELFK